MNHPIRSQSDLIYVTRHVARNVTRHVARKVTRHLTRNVAWHAAGPLVLGLAIAGCGEDRDAPIEVSGHIEATEIRLASKVPGRLMEMSVDEGDTVTLGQMVAQVDTTDLHLIWLANRAERAQAQAELRLRMAGARSEDIETARAAMRQSETELEAARKDLERMRTLLETGSATEKAAEDAVTRVELAESRLTAAREQWQRLQRGSRPEEIDAAASRLDLAEARLAQVRQQIEDARITAPSDGRITEKLAEPGELLGVGSPVAVLVDLAHPWLTVFLGEPDLSHVSLGQEVTVRSDGGEERTGHLRYISSEAEFTPRNVQTRDERIKLVFEARIGLENRDGLWKPGMPAEARLPVRNRAS
jgi:HlyD family secretion protein